MPEAIELGPMFSHHCIVCDGAVARDAFSAGEARESGFLPYGTATLCSTDKKRVARGTVHIPPEKLPLRDRVNAIGLQDYLKKRRKRLGV